MAATIFVVRVIIFVLEGAILIKVDRHLDEDFPLCSVPQDRHSNETQPSERVRVSRPARVLDQAAERAA